MASHPRPNLAPTVASVLDRQPDAVLWEIRSGLIELISRKSLELAQIEEALAQKNVASVDSTDPDPPSGAAAEGNDADTEAA